MPKGFLIDLGPTAGLYYSNGKFYDADGNRVDPNNRPAPAAQPQTAPAAVPPPVPAKPFALPSFDGSMFPEVSMVPPVPAPPMQAPPAQRMPEPQAPLPTFQPAPQPQQILPSFAQAQPEPAPGLPNFISPASVSPVGPRPAPVQFVEKRAGGLIEARDYAPAPEMPGYAQAQTGAPFRAAPQAADLGNLFGQMSKTPQPFGAPEPAKDGDYYADLYRSIAGRIF